MKRAKTATFLIELPLQVDEGQAKRLHAHLEAGRCLYNALLCEALKRLRRMRRDPAWQAARAIPRTRPQERGAAFSRLRQKHSFSEFALHDFAKGARCSWIADHIDSTMAQTLATRAYQAVNRVCLGKAKGVRFKSRGRELDSVEGKRNDVGLRFILDPGVGDGGFLLWHQDVISAIIEWRDPVIQHGLRHPIKYVRLIRRKTSGPRAKGARYTTKQGTESCHYAVQLILEGHPASAGPGAFVKPKHEAVGHDIVGLDIGPSTLAMVPREGEARLVLFCEALAPNTRAKRRLQRQMDRQRRANNPENYDEKGRARKGKRRWKESQRYRRTRRRHATAERKLAAHRKSLHGRLAHEIVRQGHQIQIEKLSYKGWQKHFDKSVGLRALGMFVAHLKRTVAKTGGILAAVPTWSTKLSQLCHGCKQYVKKPLSERWHHCSCGIGPVQRDLSSALLLAFLTVSPGGELQDPLPSIAQSDWEGAELRLRGAMESFKPGSLRGGQ